MNTRIRYVEMGEDHASPPLLMVHGFNGSANYWFPHTMPAMAAGRRAVALDLPGNGWSGRWEVYSLDALVRCILEFMDAIDLDTIDIMGHSMGGEIVSVLAARHPDRFRKLVLVDSAGARKLRLNLFTYARMLGDPCMRQVPLIPLLFGVALKGRAWRESLNMLRDTSIGNDLKLLNLPTLIIWGEQDHVIPLEHGKLMAQQIPHARLEIMRGIGHMPFWEKPDEFNRLVLEFLGRD